MYLYNVNSNLSELSSSLSYKNLYSGTLTVGSSVNIANISSYKNFIIQTNFGTFEAVRTETGTNIMCVFGYPTSNENMYIGALRLDVSNISVKYQYATAYVFTENRISLYSGTINILQILAR